MECRTTERTTMTMWTAKCSLKSGITSGIRLTSSTRRRNLVYVNTGHTKKDGTTDEKAHERKLKWDEENRLLASDDDGFVTNYWYDAEGERTVKTSGESEQVYVNSEFAGGRTNTAKFSLYVSPYLVANQGGRYTKHIYIGSQRIVSKIGDFASYGADPRRIQYAGKEADAVNVDYDVKYSQQLQAIKENYATFGVPYNGTDNDDYVDGEGFCCNDGTMEAAIAQANAPEDNFQEGDAYEDLQFYYHTDHLGSSSYITNLDGEVVQHIEYVPFGEVFIEERNNIWNTPYLFNAKEFDEETGLYYYGARYYDPRVCNFISVDKFAEKYPYFTPYCYTANSPQKFIDINGDSIAVLNLGGLIGHSALLIQNDNGKWSYFSMNGTNVYDKTYGLAGGKPYHDLGEKSFDSPQDFLNSSYNRTANNEKEILDNTVNNYGYKEAYILPTNSTQDNIIETEFRKNAKNGYSLINNQCAQVVQKSLKAAGINTEEEVFRFYDSMISIGQMVKEAPYMPSSTFRTIRHNNPNGKYIQKK